MMYMDMKGGESYKEISKQTKLTHTIHDGIFTYVYQKKPKCR